MDTVLITSYKSICRVKSEETKSGYFYHHRMLLFPKLQEYSIRKKYLIENFFKLLLFTKFKLNPKYTYKETHSYESKYILARHNKRGYLKLPLCFFIAANMYAISPEATTHLINFH